MREFHTSGLLYHVNETVLWPLGLALAHLRGDANRLAKRLRHPRAHTVCACAGCQGILAKNVMRIHTNHKMKSCFSKRLFKDTNRSDTC